MHNRAIRVLPFTPRSLYVLDTVRQIKAIPDDEVEYTKEEVEWMERAIPNLNFWIREAGVLGLDCSWVYTRKAQVEEQLKAAMQV